MNKEKIKELDTLRKELEILNHIKGTFALGIEGNITNTKIRLGKVKRKGYALYTINNNHSMPIDEIILPKELRILLYNEVCKSIIEKEKQIEEL